MSILKAENLMKAFGVDTLFHSVGFELRRGEKVGLIGANGTGKTTLMRCLLGFVKPDDGQVSLPPGEIIGYVEQAAGQGGGTLYEELRSAYQDLLLCQEKIRRLETAIANRPAGDELDRLMKEYAAAVERFEWGGGYEMENRIRRVAIGLGFTPEDMDRPTAAFSGGQKTRIALARALLRQPDYLFLDEPTNHLDIGMVEWLEAFLAEYPGGVLIISHDRYFLDRVTERTFELENGSLTVYNGGYTEYMIQKTERLAALEASFEKQQAYIAKTQAYINKYRAGIKSKQARGRQSQLDRLERIVLPETAPVLTFQFPTVGECAERVAEADTVTAGYGERIVLNGVSVFIRRGDRAALVGPNGSGKTTFLKLFTGQLTPVKGRIKLGSRVKMGYFDQEHHGLQPDFRVLDELMADFAFSEERARGLLGAFLFRGDDVYRRVGDLSGGEKARLSLLKLMLTGANFLVLDEPTNHLDIPSREAVEDAILAYPGAFLIVSHDRYFLDKIADRVLELDDGRITGYLGSFSDYQEQKEKAVKEAAKQEQELRKSQSNLPAAPEKGKPRSSRQRQQSQEKQLKKLEQEIQELEAQQKVLAEQLNDPATHANPETSRSLAEDYQQVETRLAECYDQWLELQEESAQESI
ncbi:ABC-F family ATP-binding cassette domain-containing protein [Acetonema longum]|uniref:ABC transporter n=1 Tax=Acetonema longum DSM 6540 TaxID=1009370 RepID=F7NNT5_9FIRM|nr:ABC-F family ATP-binding cassette domain-containing protein [Acetonema longum]EGO62269.1 ABC transporter [Acetonema longum DSM 6540]